MQVRLTKASIRTYHMRMKHEPILRAKRRPTNVTLPEELTSCARELGVSISKACEAGLAAAVKAERERRWVEENRPAMKAWNVWLEENGMPFEDIRLF